MDIFTAILISLCGSILSGIVAALGSAFVSVRVIKAEFNMHQKFDDDRFGLVNRRLDTLNERLIK